MKNTKGKTGKRWMAICLLCMGLMGGAATRVQAEEALEASQFSQLMTATEKIEAKEKPEQGAETLLSFEAGAVIYVTGETENGWYQISYQGQTAYVEKNVLQEQEMDTEAMDAELKAQEDESRMIVEEVERYRAEAKRSKIWGTVIVLLVIGIFAAGIISTMQGEKEKKSGETGEEENEAESSSEPEIIDLDEENS